MAFYISSVRNLFEKNIEKCMQQLNYFPLDWNLLLLCSEAICERDIRIKIRIELNSLNVDEISIILSLA